MYSINELLDGALEYFQERLSDGDQNEHYAFDTIHEVADSRIPIYTKDVLELALYDTRLAVSEPDISTSPGKCHPIQIIQWNIYERIYDKLSEWYQENKG